MLKHRRAVGNGTAAEAKTYDLDAEQALLGSILFDNAVLKTLGEIVDARHLYEPFHRRLFEAIQERFKVGELAEPIALAEYFAADSAFKELGGIRYLADLVDRAPRQTNAVAYGLRVRDLALHRERSSDGRAAPFIFGLLTPDGQVQVDRVAEVFGMSVGQLADTTGLGRDTLSKSARRNAPKTRARLTEMLEIISRVEVWAGGHLQAMAWYRAQPIPALGDRTAESLVKSGEAGLVRAYLDHIALGGFA